MRIGSSWSRPYLTGAMQQTQLNRSLQRWLDRLADRYDDWELFPDMRPIGEIVAGIVAKLPPAAEPAAQCSRARLALHPIAATKTASSASRAAGPAIWRARRAARRSSILI